jgi:hypothetical protein
MDWGFRINDEASVASGRIDRVSLRAAAGFVCCVARAAALANKRIARCHVPKHR